MAQSTPPARPVQLHVIHDLGGGAAKWLADYCKADAERTNLVLRPYAHDTAMASGVALYLDATDDTPVKTWAFSKKIAASAVEHPEYRAALDEVVARHGVGAILVSSLIGHSLEVLDTGLPTIVVCHDYFPYCPAINLYFDGVCTQCDDARMATCGRENDRFNPFDGFGSEDRARVRERFMQLTSHPTVTLATPSASVEKNLKRLNPRFEQVRFATIPHGYANPLPHVEMGELGADERLRILVMGQLSVAKGLELMRGALPRLTQFAEIYMVGARELGELFKFEKHVHVTSDYEMRELAPHVKNIRPHVALLTSVVSETFGYALSELWMMGIPVAATRVGSFPERIRPGENGYLYEPDMPSLVACMRGIHADRETLARIRANLASFQHRTAEDMVADYHRLAPLEPVAPAEAEAQSPGAATADKAVAVEAATVASMWKQIRSLNLQMAIVSDARLRTEMARLAEADARRKVEDRLQVFGRAIAEREAALLQREMEAQNLRSLVEAQQASLNAVYASTSWRVSAPVRWVGFALPRVRAALRYVFSLVASPMKTLDRSRQMMRAYRAEGWEGARQEARNIEYMERDTNAWDAYHEEFAREVRPKIVARVASMQRKPVISIVVPVYNPVEDMFLQMLESVRNQLYPYWELCLADDYSTEGRVRMILQDYAAKDRRIKVSFANENGGVSKASNRALEMATGEFTVLVDHDDILEEQALYRFAESIVDDDPDMIYSDEVLVKHDGNTVMRYGYRPAFSLEYLRSHPYIVHLTGFRTSLLRELGGWDEKLRISQDYDLILRAAEKARRIAHIPEVLYRWRIHGSSAGIEKQGQVMATSKGVLDRHLERSGIAGHAEDGPSFNLFSTRYPLEAGLKVAIIIPTKNHGDLLKQCIDSIHKTVTGVPYHILVVDHESDERATQAYLSSITGEVQVARYEGAFNFGAINNWAVTQLDGGPYTHYLLCNNDIEAYEEGWLERMLELGQQRDVGMVGAKLFYPDRKTVQHGGVCVGMYGAAEHYGKRLQYPGDPVEHGFGELLLLTHEVAAVTAACVLVRMDAWDEVGGFDEAIAVGFGDVDLCLRIDQAGYRILFCPHARLVHHESFTRGVSRTDPHPADSALYRMKWKDFMKAGDPYYSPNLSLTSTKWEQRRPIPANLDVRRRVSSIDREAGRTRVKVTGTQKG